jgi:hypothetical protein
VNFICTKAAQYRVFSAESYKLQKMGGTILGMATSPYYKSFHYGDDFDLKVLIPSDILTHIDYRSGLRVKKVIHYPRFQFIPLI